MAEQGQLGWLDASDLLSLAAAQMAFLFCWGSSGPQDDKHVLPDEGVRPRELCEVFDVVRGVGRVGA